MVNSFLMLIFWYFQMSNLGEFNVVDMCLMYFDQYLKWNLRERRRRKQKQKFFIKTSLQVNDEIVSSSFTFFQLKMSRKRKMKIEVFIFLIFFQKCLARSVVKSSGRRCSTTTSNIEHFQPQQVHLALAGKYF